MTGPTISVIRASRRCLHRLPRTARRRRPRRLAVDRRHGRAAAPASQSLLRHRRAPPALFRARRAPAGSSSCSSATRCCRTRSWSACRAVSFERALRGADRRIPGIAVEGCGEGEVALQERRELLPAGLKIAVACCGFAIGRILQAIPLMVGGDPRDLRAAAADPGRSGAGDGRASIRCRRSSGRRSKATTT